MSNKKAAPWWIKRLRCNSRWTWIAVGPDRVLRYFGSQPEAMAYATTGGKGWITREFQRARNRNAQVPEWAQPVVTTRRNHVR